MLRPRCPDARSRAGNLLGVMTAAPLGPSTDHPRGFSEAKWFKSTTLIALERRHFHNRDAHRNRVLLRWWSGP